MKKIRVSDKVTVFVKMNKNGHFTIIWQGKEYGRFTRTPSPCQIRKAIGL